MQFVNYDFIETLGIKMKEGRAFSKDFGADHSKIICNETATDIMGFKDPIGKTITLRGEEKQIIGVTRDFHFESLHKSIDPLIFALAKPSENLKIVARIKPGTERRTSEIGIRKVFGSSVPRIVYLLSGDFTILVVASIFIALPVSYFITSNWLNACAYRIQLEWWHFIGSGLLALIIAWITVGTIALKTANINPANCLREE
jgi:hypothetical protein